MINYNLDLFLFLYFHLNWTHCSLEDVASTTNTCVLFKQNLSISSEIELKWMPQDLTEEKSTLVWVMAWCRQAASHYLTNVDQVLKHHMESLGLTS